MKISGETVGGVWQMVQNTGYGAEGEQRRKLSGKRTEVGRKLWKDCDGGR